MTLCYLTVAAHLAGEAASDSATSFDGRDEDRLKWALKNADPQALQQQADAAKKSSNPNPDAEERRARATEAMAALSALHDLPSETQLMEGALAVLLNGSAPLEKRQALDALHILVEQIDNADHLLAVGGTAPLVALLGADMAHEAAAARVLAVAASNNIPFQEKLLEQHPDVVLRLVALLGAAADDSVAAAVLAIGAIVRGTPVGRRLWTEALGSGVLHSLVSGGKQSTPRTQRRALSLATDLLPAEGSAEEAAGLAGAAVALLRSAPTPATAGTGAGDRLDLDLVEKAILALDAVRERADGGPILAHAGADGALVGAVTVLRAIEKAGNELSEYAADVIDLATGALQNIRSSLNREEL